MKKKVFTGALLCIIATGGILLAADHIDAPAVTGPGSTSPGNDIFVIYAFQSPADNSKMVLVLNTQGLISPTASATASFRLMYCMNSISIIQGIMWKTLVIQCLIQNGKMRVYGPVAVGTPGLTSTIKTSGPVTEVMVTGYVVAANTGSNSNGIRVFAGPRDDPFFFDLARFKEIVGGTQSKLCNPGVDTFAGTNVMSIVVEVPKTLLDPVPPSMYGEKQNSK